MKKMNSQQGYVCVSVCVHARARTLAEKAAEVVREKCLKEKDLLKQQGLSKASLEISIT